MKRLPNKLALLFIWLYRNCISPIFPPSCRFHPTCSNYAAEAYMRHGFIKSTWLTLIRILKCQPFYKGSSFDPVPPCKHDKTDLNG